MSYIIKIGQRFLNYHSTPRKLWIGYKDHTKIFARLSTTEKYLITLKRIYPDKIVKIIVL